MNKASKTIRTSSCRRETRILVHVEQECGFLHGVPTVSLRTVQERRVVSALVPEEYGQREIFRLDWEENIKNKTPSCVRKPHLHAGVDVEAHVVVLYFRLTLM